MRYICIYIFFLIGSSPVRLYGEGIPADGSAQSSPVPDLTNWIQYPNGGVTYRIGSPLLIKFDLMLHNPGSGPAIVIELYKGSTMVAGPSLGGLTNRSISTTGLSAGSDYRIRAYVYGTSPLQEDWSNSYFSLTAGGPIAGACPPPVTYNGVGCVSGGPAVLHASNTENICGKTVTHKWYTSETGSTFISGLVESTGTCAVYNTSVSVSTVTTYWVSAVIDGCETARTRVSSSFDPTVPTLTVSPTLQVNGGIYSGAVYCALDGSASPTFTASGGSTGSSYQWYTTPTGGSVVYSGASYSPAININETTNGIKTYYVGATLTNEGGCTFLVNPRVAVSVKLLNYSNTSNAGPDKESFADDGRIELTPGGPGYVWSGPGTSVAVNFFYPDVAGPGTHQIGNALVWSYPDTQTQCTSSPDYAMYTVYPGAEIEIVGNPFISKDHGVMLRSKNTHDTYQWYDPDGLVVGATNSTFTATKTGLYRLKITNGSISKTVFKEITSKGDNVNFITTYIPQKAGYKKNNQLPISSVENVNEATVYYDDLGRPMQTVATQNSQSKVDLVVPTAYDDYGREVKKFLPYTGGSDGNLKTDALQDPETLEITDEGKYRSGAQWNFYQTGGLVAADQFPYAETRLEDNPLNRVVEQSSPGHAWKLDEMNGYESPDKTIKKRYEFNGVSEVLNFQYVAPDATYPTGMVRLGNPAYYRANRLYKNKTKDEEGHEVIEFVDNDGRTILKKVQASPTTFAQTYYVYDDYGSLVAVIPPEATQGILGKLTVTWSNLASGHSVGNAPLNNKLTKTSAAGYANSGATVSGLLANTDGWVEMVADETNTSRMIGLNTGSGGNGTAIPFAIEFRNDGKIYIWENTPSATPLDSYSYGTVVRVARAGTTIKYYVNGILRQVSSVSAPSGAMLADIALNETQATIQGLTTSFNVSETNISTLLDNYGFLYTYDKHRRMSQKKLPGVQPVYLVYDSRDRLVATQDGNQRSLATKYWSFTKYDELNRPIATGIKDTTAALTQALMQQAVDNHYAKAWTKLYETFVGNAPGNIHGYSNNSYPVITRGALAEFAMYLTVTYYDNYAFRNDWAGTYAYKNDRLFSSTATGDYSQVTTGSENQRVIGLVTGSKIKVLHGGIHGGYTWLKSISYYDDKYRVIQTQSDNNKSGLDRVSNLYDFAGKILKTKTVHTTMDLSWEQRTGVTPEGNWIAKKSGLAEAWGVSGAASQDKLAANQDGWVEYVVGSHKPYRIFGFSPVTKPANGELTSVTYGFYLLDSSFPLRVYKGSVFKLNAPGGVKSGDVLRIAREGNYIKYYRNDQVIYSDTVSTNAMRVSVAFSSNGASFEGLKTSFSLREDSVIRSYEYDHANRLTKLWHRYNDGTDYLLQKNEYNELGQLVDKKLHSTDAAGATAKQSVDMRYNIRGWLTSMNNAALTDDGITNNDATDYFGMSLSYNTVDGDLGNTALYNGNIAAMKWSNYPGTGTIKQKGYTYTYDAMNRIAGSTFNEKTSSWDAASNNGFAETGYTYDLNGNILTMQRNDKRASGWMDNLVYNYGSGATKSNKLLKVEDTGDDYAGFIDGNPSLATDFTTTTDDYRYDANGNMVNDRNKGIGTTNSDNSITYNFLNLTDLVTKGGNTVRYIYDVTGRKLSQVVAFGGTLKQTDYAGEFNYENDVLQFISHEEGRIVTTATEHIYTNSFDAVTDDLTTIGATTSPYAINGQKYLKVTSGSATAGNGVLPIAGTMNVTAGERFRIRVKGYRTTNPVNLQVKAGSTVLGNTALPGNATNESWVEQIVTIPNGSTTLQAGVVWEATVVNGEIFYLNEFEITQLSTAEPEYQYNLKDHLGNVRLTFTTKTKTTTYTAGYETANQSTEAANFDSYPSGGGKINTQPENARTGTNSQVLNGGYSGRIGLAKSFSVMPGDIVSIQAYARYSTTEGLPADYSGFVTALLSAFNLSTPAVGETGTASAGVNSFANWELGPSGNANGPAPMKAFVTIILFDRDYNPIDVAYDASTASGALMSKSYTVREPGYAYLYISNEHPNMVDTYFDDVAISYTPSAVIQTNDYYPFGLTFNSFNRENALFNQFQYNGKEKQDELGLEWLDYGARMYMPEIGRWGAVDPMAEYYLSWTPYCYALDNPTTFNDIEGLMVGDPKYTGSGNVVIVIRDSPDEFWNMTSLDNTAWDYGNFNTLQEADEWMKKTYGADGIGINNLIIKTHGTSGAVGNSEESGVYLKDEAHLSGVFPDTWVGPQDVDPDVKRTPDGQKKNAVALLNIAKRLNEGGTLLLTGCNISLYGNAFPDALFKAINGHNKKLTLYTNKATTNIMGWGGKVRVNRYINEKAKPWKPWVRTTNKGSIDFPRLPALHTSGQFFFMPYIPTTSSTSSSETSNKPPKKPRYEN